MSSSAYGRRTAVAVLATLAVIVSVHGVAAAAPAWMAGDLHTHSYLTDGQTTHADVASHAFEQYGIDWLANSEHGGRFSRDASGNPLPEPMWRWQSLAELSFPRVQALRAAYPGSMVVQGVEWNVPTHEHASVGIVASEPTSVAEFEYRFDANDASTSFMAAPLPKTNSTAAHAIGGVAYLQAHYPTAAYVVVNHPSRRLEYSAADLRDLIRAGPDVFVGIEGMPGHQKSAERGGYDRVSDPATLAEARTYGGADPMVAQVGGVWDALLAEGYGVGVFANTDFHTATSCFWPGEYSKTHTYVESPGDYTSLVAGLQRGRSFSAFGDLIDQLTFTATAEETEVEVGDGRLAIMQGQEVTVTATFHVPATNHHGDAPVVDHVDLIGSVVHAPCPPGSIGYALESNPDAHVLEQFRGAEIESLGGGWHRVTLPLDDVGSDMYLRLRGTNLAPSTPLETDADGDPLSDELKAPNTAEKAWADLWFYSNALWIDVDGAPKSMITYLSKPAARSTSAPYAVQGATLRKYRTYRWAGYVAPRHAVGGHAVYLSVKRFVSGQGFVHYRRYTATNYAHLSISGYAANFPLPPGRYKLVPVAAEDSLHMRTVGTPSYYTVR